MKKQTSRRETERTERVGNDVFLRRGSSLERKRILERVDCEEQAGNP